ncbi:MAG: aminotransferase class V-fold PLP-dependent enzyme [Alicyclobacillus sp.]|nr:aminotransferase class V-fold PLP-dependent enzyme [Alicyclobacillus sp.]
MALADSLRRYFPAARLGTYLDTAACGLLPDCAGEAARDVWEQVVQQGRHRTHYSEQLRAVRAEVKAQLAHVLHCDAAALALTEGPVQALNLALWAWPLQAGDEVLYSGLDSPAVLLPLYAQKLRRGVVLRSVPVTADPEAWLANLMAAWSGRTRLVVCAHVAPGSGIRLPVEALAPVVHERQAALLVEGSWGAGADFLHVTAAGVDAYACAGQHWLCGPDGTGVLYVRASQLSGLDPVWLGPAGLRSPRALDEFGMFLGAPDARRLEWADSALANWHAWLASLRLLRTQAGWEYIGERVRGLSGQLWQALVDVPGVEVLTPRAARAGMICFRLNQVAPERLAAAARDAQLYLGVTPDGSALCASVAVYNHEDDVERLAAWLRKPPVTAADAGLAPRSDPSANPGL